MKMVRIEADRCYDLPAFVAAQQRVRDGASPVVMESSSSSASPETGRELANGWRLRAINACDFSGLSLFNELVIERLQTVLPRRKTTVNFAFFEFGSSSIVIAYGDAGDGGKASAPLPSVGGGVVEEIETKLEELVSCIHHTCTAVAADAVNR
ncbi:hypothetical protein FOZ62_013833, partial [Perkinsus olseni]